MGMHIVGEVETNIPETSEMFTRLQEANKRLKDPFVVRQYERYRKKWFKYEAYFVYDVIDTYDNCIIVENSTERGVELYLLGIINGMQSYELGLCQRALYRVK